MSLLSRKLMSESAVGGSYIVFARQQSVEVVDNTNPDQPSLLTSVLPDGGARSADFRPDGKYIAVGDSASTVRMYDFSSRTSLTLVDTLQIPASPLRPDRLLYGLRWSPDMKYVAVGVERESDAAELYLLDCTDPTNISISDELEMNTTIWAMEYSPRGDYLVITTNAGITTIDTSTPGSLSILDTYNLGTFNEGLALSENGNLAAVSGNRDAVLLFDLSNPNAISLISSNPSTIDLSYDLAFSETEDKIFEVGLETSGDPRITKVLYNIAADKTLTVEQTYTTSTVSTYGVAFSPDGTQIAFIDTFRNIVYNFSPPNSLAETYTSTGYLTTSGHDIRFSLI